MQPHLLIVDGHHLLYRAYWAIPRTMKTGSGEQVNTSFGVASMLLQMLKAEEPDEVLFCFDADEQTFRHKEYAEYKSGRAETPDDFYVQIPRAMELVETFGIKSVDGNSYEADDYVCSYARAAERAGQRVTLVSGDRDLLQLVSENVRVAIPHKGYQAAEYLGPAEVEKKYGVTPAQITSYKGLVGDPSDNLPGVKGIGPVAATALIQKYGSNEQIYANLKDIKPAWRTKLEQGHEQALFCERMSILTCDIPLAFSFDDLVLSSVDSLAITALFADLEFTLLTRRFQALLDSPYGKAHFLALPPSAMMSANSHHKTSETKRAAEQLILL